MDRCVLCIQDGLVESALEASGFLLIVCVAVVSVCVCAWLGGWPGRHRVAHLQSARCREVLAINAMGVGLKSRKKRRKAKRKAKRMRMCSSLFFFSLSRWQVQKEEEDDDDDLICSWPLCASPTA